MRISDWSSDVCSSDLRIGCCSWRSLPIPSSLHSVVSVRTVACDPCAITIAQEGDGTEVPTQRFGWVVRMAWASARSDFEVITTTSDRKSVVWGKSVSVRVDIGGRRLIKKTNTNKTLVNST